MRQAPIKREKKIEIPKVNYERARALILNRMLKVFGDSSPGMSSATKVANELTDQLRDADLLNPKVDRS